MVGAPTRARRQAVQLGLIGLGRMGGNIVRRLMRSGHVCVVFDRDPNAVARLVEEGATGSASLAALVAGLDPPRAVWVMLPAGRATEATVAEFGRIFDRRGTLVAAGHP